MGLDVIDDPDISMFYYLAGTAVLKYVMFHWLSGRTSKKPELVGKVAKITLHPIKSVPGLDLPVAECTQNGIKIAGKNLRDRQFMITNSDYGFVSQRLDPKLSLLRVSYEDSELWLKTQDGSCPPVLFKIPNLQGAQVVDTLVHGFKHEGVDCGDEVAQWISKYLGKEGYRVVYTDPSLSGRDVSTYLERKRLQSDILSTQNDKVGFHDSCPFMLLTESSIADLNTRLDKKVSVRNFRPSILLTGCDPYVEDDWRHVWIGDKAKFTYISPNARCVFINNDPDQGVHDPKYEPLKTLRKYRLLLPEFEQSPCLGIYLALEQAGVIKVGDPVYALK